MPIRLWTLSIVLSFLTGEYFSSWFWFGQEVEDWGWAFSKWFISLEPQSNGGWCSYPLCSACAWMVGSTVPRSVDGKKRIIGIASKVTRLVTLGLLFLGPSKILNILGKNMWPGPQAVLDQCNLHGSDKWHVEGNAAALGDLMMSVHQTKCQAYITYFLFQTFAVFWMLYVFFWVIPRCLNFICQRFGTLCLFHLHRQVRVERWNRQSVSKHQHIKFRPRGITQKKAYNMYNIPHERAYVPHGFK